MTLPSKSKAEEKRIEKLRLQDVNRRFLDKNYDAVSFCHKHGLTVYAAVQAGSMKVKIFREKDEKFLPISERLYAQDDLQDIKEKCAAIDMEYERIYLKMKDKV